jgi:hypothetical protein
LFLVFVQWRFRGFLVIAIRLVHRERFCSACRIFAKFTRSGDHIYVQLVEAFLDEAGRLRLCTISLQGPLDESGGQVSNI